jgi:hypothetical protein
MLALNTSSFTIASVLQLAANLVARLEKHLPGEQTSQFKAAIQSDDDAHLVANFIRDIAGWVIGLPLRGQSGTSALPPKAAAAVSRRRVRFGPSTDSCIAAKRGLFDHLIGEREQIWRYIETERLGGLEVDHEFVRLLHRKQ